MEIRTAPQHDESFDLIIEPGNTTRRYWRDLWAYRELFVFLAWRDILVRYKQTVIGVAWSVLRPVLTMIVFTVIFGKVAKLPSDGATPYAIMVFAGLLPWQLFSYALSDSSNSLIGNANLLSKVYFPRMIVPASAIIVTLVDFVITFGIFVVIMIWYQFVPSWQIVFLPLLILMVLATTFGAGLWLAALNVKYRDFRFIVPFIVQFGMFVSPVGFSSAVLANEWRWVYSLNPMVGVIDGFRWAILGDDANFYLPGFLVSMGVLVVILLIGITYFRKVERAFADII